MYMYLCGDFQVGIWENRELQWQPMTSCLPDNP